MDTITENLLCGLRAEIAWKPAFPCLRDYYRAKGYAQSPDGEPNVIKRARGIAALFREHKKYIYENDVIAGSYRGLFDGGRDIASGADCEHASALVGEMGERSFWTNYDHFAANYAHVLSRGVGGILADIDSSLEIYREDAEKNAFLIGAKMTMTAFSDMIKEYADAAREKAANAVTEEARGRFTEIAATCDAVTLDAPTTFREALQLVWLCHVSFFCEGRYAIAFGRLDQYLYPFYCRDIGNGTLTEDEARRYLTLTLYKIHEATYAGGDDVCNIAIGGVKPEDGSDATNALSFRILEAVEACKVPGPNLSARIHENTTDAFLDACLRVIGSGIGYPALMNDDVNIAALSRMGYTIEDCRNYCMVGCIENFIQGKQPPWSDGRYNTPVFLEYALNNGRSFLDGALRGIETGEPDSFETMDDLLAAFRKQLEAGAKQYVDGFTTFNASPDPLLFQSPYLSCYCDDCIARGLDINNGGAHYPSAHGAGLMGIATVADSLAAIEQVVYRDKTVTLSELRDILKQNFEGREAFRQKLLSLPKYGNDNEFVDKYAIWFVNVQADIFDAYRTYDGGRFYIAIASNVSNIPAGLEIGASADGRFAKSPLSDAASPMHGRDIHGPTASILSLSKPDYTRAACGTVVNQKYTAEMLRDPEKRARLAALIRTYFKRGGQEVQINAVSRETLIDAKEHPENYEALVVRVSGFSAFYTKLSREVQEDILARTEHGRAN